MCILSRHIAHITTNCILSGAAECKRLAQQYEQLFELFPDLESDLKYLTADETRMTNYIDFVSSHSFGNVHICRLIARIHLVQLAQ